MEKTVNLAKCITNYIVIEIINYYQIGEKKTSY